MKYEDFLKELLENRIGLKGELTIDGIEIEDIEKKQKVIKQLIELRSEVMTKWSNLLEKYNQEFDFVIYRDRVLVNIYLPPLSNRIDDNEFIIYRNHKAYRVMHMLIMEIDENGIVWVYYPPMGL